MLFDLDDTLTDRGASIAAYALRFRQDFAAHLADISHADLVATIARADQGGYCPAARRAEQMVGDLPWSQLASADRLEAHWRAVFPGMNKARSEALSTLGVLAERGLVLGILSNGTVAAQQVKIDRLGFARFVRTVVISEAVQMKKPDPALFHLTLERLGVDAAATWFVGDHPRNDIGGAEAVGMSAIWIDAGTPWPDDLPAPRQRIVRLSQVVDLIDQAPH